MVNKTITYNDAERVFNLFMKNFTTASVSTLSITAMDEEFDIAAMFADTPERRNSKFRLSDGNTVFVETLYSDYDFNTDGAWELEKTSEASEVISAIAELHPNAYENDLRSQERIMAAFVSLTRSISRYLPDSIVEEYQERIALEELDDEDIEDSVEVVGSILTRLTVDKEDEDDLKMVAVIYSVLLRFEEVSFAINFNFNNCLHVGSDINTSAIMAEPSIMEARSFTHGYIGSIVTKILGPCDVLEQSVTYVTAFNKMDYADYTFIYLLNSLMYTVAVQPHAVYRALKPLNYFTIQDINVSLSGDVVPTDNEAFIAFIDDGGLDVDEGLVDGIDSFGTQGHLHVLVTFDKFDSRSGEQEFFDTTLAEYTDNILYKYMGVNITKPIMRAYTIEEYVEELYYALVKWVGNPLTLKNRSFTEIELPEDKPAGPFVNAGNLFFENVNTTPLWLYLIGLPVVMKLSQDIDDDAAMELVEYSEDGVEGTPTFTEAVGALKKLLNKHWN